MNEVHVIPDERTMWRVYDDDAAAPISEHTNATEAQLAARARAEDRDAERVVVHDRYHRTHEAVSSPAGAAAREQLDRARRLARVRERAKQLVRAARQPRAAGGTRGTSLPGPHETGGPRRVGSRGEPPASPSAGFNRLDLADPRSRS